MTVPEPIRPIDTEVEQRAIGAESFESMLNRSGARAAKRSTRQRWRFFCSILARSFAPKPCPFLTSTPLPYFLPGAVLRNAFARRLLASSACAAQDVASRRRKVAAASSSSCPSCCCCGNRSTSSRCAYGRRRTARSAFADRPEPRLLLRAHAYLPSVCVAHGWRLNDSDGDGNERAARAGPGQRWATAVGVHDWPTRVLWDGRQAWLPGRRPRMCMACMCTHVLLTHEGERGQGGQKKFLRGFGELSSR